MKLVVYGTLRVGESLHYIIKRMMNLCKKADRREPTMEVVNLEGYSMYHLGRFPGLKEGSKKDSCVAEIWDIDVSEDWEKEILEILDDVESVDSGLYERKNIETSAGKAWIYLFLGPIRADMKIRDWKKEKNRVLEKGYTTPR